MKTVNQSMRKKDAMQLVTGQPVYMDDVIPQDCLIVKLLRSPHANAIVQEIDTSRALLVPGIEAIYTWKDVDQQGRRYTQAGQPYPPPTPRIPRLRGGAPSRPREAPPQCTFFPRKRG